MTNARKTVCAVALAAGTLIFGANRANAEITLDLASSSPQVDGTSALFYSTDLQPTGTGVIQPFVRIQAKPAEEGYNTDGAIEFDTKDHTGQNWTHSITLADVPIVSIGGVDYREFILDINETSTKAGRFLAMNELEIYTSDTNLLTSFDRTNHTFGSPVGNVTSLAYDMDASGDKLVKMDYSQASGSGSGDMFVYVKSSLFGAGPYVYLYSKFGDPDGSDAGFEEWATRPAAPAVPLPASVWGGLTLLGCMGAAKVRSRRRSA